MTTKKTAIKKTPTKKPAKKSAHAEPKQVEVVDENTNVIFGETKESANKNGPKFIDGFLHLNELDLARYELAQAKCLNAFQAIGLKKSEVEEAKRAFEDKVRRSNEELQHIVQVSRRIENELKALQEELQKTYKLDFSQVVYDDVTGKVTHLGEFISEEHFNVKK